jgi:hypothetical protein
MRHLAIVILASLCSAPQKAPAGIDRTPQSVEVDGPRWLARPITGLDDAIAIDTDARQACAIRADGSLHCWGRSTRMRRRRGDLLGRPQTYLIAGNDLSPRDYVFPAHALEVRAGFPTCARERSGWWCLYEHWERDPSLAGTEPGWLARVHAAPMERDAETCGVDRSGRLFCVADPVFGTERMAYTSFAEVDESDRLVDTTPLFGVAGRPHVCAVTRARRARCYPALSGELAALENVVAVRVGAHAEESLVCALTSKGEVYCLDAEGFAQVEDLPPAIEMDTGGAYACARTESGEVYCWGEEPSADRHAID